MEKIVSMNILVVFANDNVVDKIRLSLKRCLDNIKIFVLDLQVDIEEDSEIIHLNNTCFEEKLELPYITSEILENLDLNLVILQNPLNPPIDNLADLCRNLNIPILYIEPFMKGDKYYIFDPVGAPYTNSVYLKDILKENVSNLCKHELITRLEQPSEITLNELVNKYQIENLDLEKTIICLGQVSTDKSIKKSPLNLNYYEWWKLLIDSNPDVLFLIKKHPLDNDELLDPIHFINKNVIIIDESIHSLGKIFNFFASYSSTTILELVSMYKKVITGGYHFFEGQGVCLETTDFNNILDKLNNIELNTLKIDLIIHNIFTKYIKELGSEELGIFLLENSTK